MSWLFGYVEKRLEKKAIMVDFKIYDVTDWISNNWNIYIVQFVKK